ncbi:hypothetical protein FE257_004413 [Aspergillus nanangensis]|uniref:Enoyl reductase (ER) domain-containing protein n=1 Tax=Aspergillus nanangensis TaxID=2582783 RepID=A0AAD4GZ78_ASPNN|nr:hypothetical protein FE257_004413 [Aspergillus nanangensis]
MTNRAIWLDKQNELRVRDVTESYHPNSSEVLVDVRFSGVNPADLLHGELGFNDYPAGYDFAGVVLEVGEEKCPQFKPGDQVFGFAAPMTPKPPQYGTHQKYHVARQYVWHVPPQMPLSEAAGMPVITHTAADALFNQLELPFDTSSSQKEATTPLLIWGGSSAVGCAAIQLAKEAGCFPILTTASPKHHSTLMSLGATECFDYRDTNIVQKIRDSLGGHTTEPLKHVLDAVVAQGGPHSSTSLCEASCQYPETTLFASPIPAAPDAKHTWRKVFACRDVNLDIALPNGGQFVVRANPEWQAKIDKATRWAIENYNVHYRMPNVVVFKGGEEGIRAIKMSASGGASLQKFVIEHPI